MKFYSKLMLIVLGASLWSCTESEYTKTVRSELGSGVNNDSIFFDINFGDSKSAFYDKCWQMNKRGLFFQGPDNQNVQYTIKSRDSLQSNIRMLFFPDFDEKDQIKEMKLTFDYTAWSPLYDRYNSDVLLNAMKDTLLNWYGGNDFIEVDIDASNKRLWVKVDGNRRIVIHKKNESTVLGKISDLRHEDIMKKINKKL